MKVFNKLTASQKKELKKGVIEVSGRAMNRTALGIVDAMFRLYPNATFDEMKKMLPDSINESAPRNYKSLFKPYTSRPYGVIQPYDIADECKKEGMNVSASHFTEDSEMFTTSDGIKVLISKSWESKDTSNQTHDLQNLITHVEQYGVRVVDFDKNKPFEKGKYSIEIINGPMLSQLTSNQKKDKKYLWLLLLLLLLLGALAVYFFLDKDNIENSQPTTIYEQTISLSASAKVY